MTAPIRIAADLSALAATPLTGVGLYTLNLFDAFLDTQPDFDVHLFASMAHANRKPLDELAPRCASAHVVRWPTRIKNPLWSTLGWPPIESVTGPVDVAYGGFNLLPATRKAARTAMVFDVAWRHFPDTKAQRSARRYDRQLRYAVRHADRLFAVSECTKADLVAFYGADANRVDVIHGGVDFDALATPVDRARLSALRTTHGIPERYLLYLGNVEPRKNLPRMLSAYARVRDTHPDTPPFVFAGPVQWRDASVAETIARLGLEDAVIRTGYLPRADAVTLLQGAYACVYVPLYEGFGLPVLEAMAAQTPVLTSNAASIPEIVGDTMPAVDPHDEEAMEAGIARLLDAYGDVLAAVPAAQARAKQFTWPASAAALARSIRETAGR